MVYLPHWPIPSTFGNSSIDFETVFLRCGEILQKLGNPHQKLPRTIHIAGTNGKGSVAQFLREILTSNGQRVDVYTSPHLHHCNERILLNGIQISDSYLYEILEEVRVAAKNTPLTFFEGLTIAAFLAFSRTNSDYLILETGLGGRIDITNIVEKKIATIITPISFDHEEFLGKKIVEIAYEKACIIRENTDLILGLQPLEAAEIIEVMAFDKNAKLIRFNKEFSIEIYENSFDFLSEKINLMSLEIPNLRGRHQIENAAIAIACCVNLGFTNVEKAMKSTFWPSRIEKIENGLLKFLPKGSEIYIDGAHNISGAASLANWIFETKNEQHKIFVIVGFSKNKCKKEFLLQFKGIVDEIIAVRVDGEPNPEESFKIAEIGALCEIKVNAQDDMLDAIYYISKNCMDKRAKVIICGSLHLARDVKKFNAPQNPDQFSILL
jgi:dihydrofolate synthase/folylpolyglutamate synthase